MAGAGGPPIPPGGVIPRRTYVPQGPPRAIPEKNPYPNHVEYSFEYWFNYFYDELNATQKRAFYLQISPAPGTLRTAAHIPDGEKRTLLDGMMNLGFRAYEENEKMTADAMFASLKSLLRPEPSRVMFRGDSREPAMIKQHMGTKPQTRLAHLHADRNFDKPWHPWNDITRRNKVYFRNGDVNQDNCLFSAISVTPEFYIATKFPMMHQVTLGKALVEVAMAPTVDASRVRSLVSQFNAGATKQMTLPCSRTNIYAVKVKKGWNTQEFQRDPFPERAYENLRWIDHFAIVKVIRIHYGDDSNKGHLTVIDSWKLLPDNSSYESNIRASMKKLTVANPTAVNVLTQQLRNFLTETAQECRLLNQIGGHPYLPEGVTAPFTIKKVLAITGI